jgi:hypothetical protein
MKVVFCTPTVEAPHPAYLAALEASVPALDAAGIGHSATFNVGGAYVSFARAEMLHRALATDADAFVFLDHDESWRPVDLVRLIETQGEVVAGTYRYKQEPEEYMGDWHRDGGGRPVLRLGDGAIRATMVPAGFLKVTRVAVRRFMRAYPELLFGDAERPAVDLFNHGAHVGGADGRWWGEDYAFCRRWGDCGGEIWLVPDLSIDHHAFPSKDHPDGRVWRGNLHEYLMRQPGGALHKAQAAA